MLKHVVILALWFYAGWTLGAFLSFATGVPEIVGPVLGAAAVAAVALGPFRSMQRGIGAPVQEGSASPAAGR